MESILVQKNFGPSARASWKFCPKFARAKILNIVLAKTGPKSVQKGSRIENRRDTPKLKFNGEYFGPKNFGPLARASWKFCPKFARAKILNIVLAKTGPKSVQKRSKIENRRDTPKLKFNGEYFGPKKFRPPCPGKLEILPKVCRAKILNIVLAKTGPKSVQKGLKIENRRDTPKLKFNGEYLKKIRPPCPGKLEILPKVCPGENFEYRSGENGPQKCPKTFENRKSPRHAKIKV